MADESFWIFDRAQVSVELVSGHLTLTQPQDIAQYEGMFHEFSDLAVHGAQARTLIACAIAAIVTDDDTRAVSR